MAGGNSALSLHRNKNKNSKMEYYKKSAHGTIRFCNNCQLYHLEFGNLNFNFTEKQLIVFRKYINEIDGEYWARVNHKTEHTRKIQLPTQLKGTNFCFHASELEELKYLLNTHLRSVDKSVFATVNYEFSLN